MKKIILFFMVFLFLPANNSLFAQKDHDSLEVQTLDEVFITGQLRPAGEKKTLCKVEAVRLNLSAFKPQIDAAGVLDNQLNIDFTHSPVFGSGLEINGIGKHNIKILLDGVPLNGRVNGVINLEQIGLSGIERIEMIEGPVSIYYGSDAIGGVVNLISAVPRTDKWANRISVLYENLKAGNINMNSLYRKGSNFATWHAGYYTFDGMNTDPGFQRSLSWPSRRQWHTGFQAGHDFDTYTVKASVNLSRQQVRTLGEIEQNQAYDTDYFTFRSGYSFSLTSKHSELKKPFLSIKAAYQDYNRYDETYRYDPATGNVQYIDAYPGANDNRFQNVFVKSFADYRWNKRYSFTAGMEYHYDKASGNRILDGAKDIHHASMVFAIQLHPGKDLHLRPALRYHVNTLHRHVWTPGFNLAYSTGKNVLRFSYARGYRLPDLKELYLDWSPVFGPFTYTFSGNRNLVPERSHSFALDYTRYYSPHTSHFVSISPSVSFHSITDMIGLSEMVDYHREYLNLNRAEILNLSIRSQWKYRDRLRLNTGVSILGRYLEYSPGYNSGGFMFSPAASLGGHYLFDNKNTSFSFDYKFSGKRPGHYIEESDDGTRQLVKTYREAFQNLNIQIAHRILHGNLMLGAGVQNVFDVTQVDSFDRIGQVHENELLLKGRYYFFKAEYRFSFFDN